MSAAVHLLLVIGTVIAAGVAWIIVGLAPETVLTVAPAVVGVMLYIRPLNFAVATASKASDLTGGSDVG